MKIENQIPTCLLLLVFCAFLVQSCTNIGVYVTNPATNMAVSNDSGLWWRQVTPFTGTEVYGLVAHGQAEIYVALDNGLIRSLDGGQNWTTLLSETTYTLYPSGVDQDYHVWASGLGFIFVEWNDWSDNTTTVGPTTDGPTTDDKVTGIYVANNRIYTGMGPSKRGLAILDEGAQNWNILNEGTVFEDAEIGAVLGSGDTVYASFKYSTGGKIAISGDNGENWETRDLLPWVENAEISYNGLWLENSTVYVATKSGLAISTDNFTTWVVKNQSNGGLSSDTAFDVAAVGDQIFVVTDSGLSVSRDGGETFNTVESGLGTDVWAVYAHCLDDTTSSSSTSTTVSTTSVSTSTVSSAAPATTTADTTTVPTTSLSPQSQPRCHPRKKPQKVDSMEI